MYVPPYVPQPTEIPGNVAAERHGVRLRFIRRVAVLHFLSVAIVAGCVLAPWEFPPLEVSLLGAILTLVAASLVRIAGRGSRWEVWVSAMLLAVLIPWLAGTLSGLIDLGLPVWPFAFGLSCALIYTFACGIDLSFVGMFFLSWLASSVLIVLFGIAESMPFADVATALSLNVIVLFYYVYDLGSLLSRRRPGEELAAVLDLYRDVLNFVGYSIHSVRHWHRSRIWLK